MLLGASQGDDVGLFSSSFIMNMVQMSSSKNVEIFCHESISPNLFKKWVRVLLLFKTIGLHLWVN